MSSSAAVCGSFSERELIRSGPGRGETAMAVTSPRRRLVLVVALLALVFVPGSMSGVAGANAARAARRRAQLPRHRTPTTLGVTSADVADVAVTSQYRSSHSGVTHVNFNQRVEGLEVFGAHVTVNVAADGRVIFAGGSLVPLGAQSGGASLPPTEAVEAAADGLDLAEPANPRVISSKGGPARATVVSPAGISSAPIPAASGLAADREGPAEGLAARDRRLLRGAPLERDRRRRDGPAARQGRLDVARQPRRR